MLIHFGDTLLVRGGYKKEEEEEEEEVPISFGLVYVPVL